jgi:hypothetical protein
MIEAAFNFGGRDFGWFGHGRLQRTLPEG